MLVSKSPLVYLITAPKSLDTGSLDIPKRIWKVLPLSERVSTGQQDKF